MSLLEELQSAWGYVSSIEPASGKVSREELSRVEGSIKQVARHVDEIDELDDDDAHGAETALVVLYARGAALAIAAGDEVQAHRWLDEAAHHANDDAYAEQFVAGHRDPERFRMLVHGRYMMANNREREARALWRELVAKRGDDALAAAALVEEKAPRPLRPGEMPTLWTYNGIGVGFSGSRDRWDDGSYVTTHCFKVVYIPIFPIRAYRVMDGDESGNYFVLAREQLSTFAKLSRYALLAVVVVAIAWGAISSYLNDPDRLAKQRWDSAIADVSKQTPEQALAALDGVLKDEIWRIDRGRTEKVGAEIVRLTAASVTRPFTRDKIEHAGRVVRRWEALPLEAKPGAARETLLAALEGWTAELPETPENAEARLELLRFTERAADARRQGPVLAKIETARLAAADAKAESSPLEALAMYVERPSTEGITRATKVVERLVASPSLLVDAGRDLETGSARPPSPPCARRRSRSSTPRSSRRRRRKWKA